MGTRNLILRLGIAAVLFFFAARPALADISGKIIGTVVDPTGAVLTGARVSLHSTSTGMKRETQTDSTGSYEFLLVPVGDDYEVDVEAVGFRKGVQAGITLLVNQVYRADFRLQLGAATQTVVVSAQAAEVETTSNQLGDVIQSKKMEDLPLNGRSYIDLLGLQTGVIPITSSEATTGTVSGNLSSGTVSVNGQRESANGFLVNGGDVEHTDENGASIVPTLDSIQEFRVLTNSFDAEYGRFSGAIVNVVTKSGTNSFHGNLYEFLRNNAFDSRNFFDLNQTNIVTGQEIPGSALAALKRNQFGGTIGGPIRRNRLFFFADYQGTRQISGASTGNIAVPSLSERSGDFSDVATTGYAPLTGVVRGDDLPGHFAQTLSSRLGYTVNPGESYWVAGCNTLSQAQAGTCVFPGEVIPQAAWSPAAQGTLQFIPSPSLIASGRPYFSTSAFSDTLRDDKLGVKIDFNTGRFGTWSAYYHFDNTNVVNPYGGGNVPGFVATSPTRAQQIDLSNTLTPNPSTVNEARVNFTRPAITNGLASGAGLGDYSKYGFVDGGLGIIHTPPTPEGVPEIDLAETGVSFGVPIPSVINDSNWQFVDNLSKVHGRHTMKFGADFRSFNDATRFRPNNGSFTFYGTETGNDFADYLLGAPDTYIQYSEEDEDPRSKYFGLYAQDSFKFRSNFTINYGLRWEFSQPWADTQGRVQAFVPGLQSKVFPDSPTGWVFPGDPGIPSTLSPTRYDNFNPRLGLAYSPAFTQGFLKKVFGGPDKSSIRASFGIFHTIYEEQTFLQETGNPPFGIYYSDSLTYLEEPYKARTTGVDPGQRFPWIPAQKYTDYSFESYLPISFVTTAKTDNVLPYAEHFNLSYQREIAKSMTLTLAYVGTAGHHLVGQIEADPGIPSECLQERAAAIAAGEPGSACGPNGEDTIYNINGQTYNGTRRYSVTSGRYLNDGLLDFAGSVLWAATFANSDYNSLQATLEKKVGGLRLLTAYTYGKSLDNDSAYSTEGVDPFDYRLSRALSAFDMTNNFVTSYVYDLPFQKLTSSSRRIVHQFLGGWSVTGITRFTTGLPVGIHESGDNSLVGSLAATFNGVDQPNYDGQPLIFTNPRRAPNNQWFSTSQFSGQQLGVVGTASRRFFHGPGLNNWDMGLHKTSQISERMSLEIRAEFFNIFNHTQFNNPVGDFANPSFGQITSARDPRIGQLAMKLTF